LRSTTTRKHTTARRPKQKRRAEWPAVFISLAFAIPSSRNNIWTNDTGDGIAGYRLDLYEGIGKAVCADYDNIMTLGACNSGTNTCPALTVQ
jgi:hypothetical protein